MSMWVEAVGLGALKWQLAAALCVFLSVSNAASGGKVGKCNSYLPGHKLLHTAVHHTVGTTHTAPVCMCMCMSVYVRQPDCSQE